MTLEIALVLALLLAAMVLFAVEWLPVDVVALLLLIVLVVSGLLSPEKVLSGFADDIIIILACILVISSTLARSGITQQIAASILSIARRKTTLTPVLMTCVAALSAFFSNTSATAMLMPATLELSKNARIRSSRLLMPLAFASILGGTCTLIGTSTNLASAGLISRLGLEPYSLFEFLLPGLLLTGLGILYMSIVGYRLIPEREKDSLMQDYQIHDYLSELLIESDSPAAGQTLGSLHLDKMGITALALVRNHKKRTAHGNRKLEAGDKIIVKSSRDALLRARDSGKLSIEAESTLTDQDIGVGEVDVSELILMPGSRFIGKSLKQLEFYNVHEVAVLAMYRRGQAFPMQIENTPLRVGDVLLVLGSEQHLEYLAANPDVWLLKADAATPLSTRKGVYALLAMIGAVVIGSLGVLPLSIAFLLGAVVLVLTGCTTMQEAYASIEWRLLVLIACMGAFGVAMQDTGTAAFIAALVVDFASKFGISATLAALGILTVVLTQPMSNAAAALVVLPVAISTAHLLGVDPRPFAIMVTLAASLSFITPLEPASLLVFGIGKYRFRDFIVVGMPLTVIVITMLVLIVPILWPI